MAQPMLNLGGNLSPEQQIEQQQIARQQRMAELLMQQGQQIPQGQMVSGRYVAPSFFQYAAPVLQSYLGRKELGKVEQRQLDIAKQLRADEISAMTDYMQQKQGRPATPEQVTEMAGPYTDNVPMPTAYMAAQPAIEANPRLAYAEALNMQSPQARALLPQIATEAFKKPEAFTLPEGSIRFQTMPDGTVRQVDTGSKKPRAPLQIDTGTAIELRDPANPTVVLQRIPKSQMPTAGQVVVSLANTITSNLNPGRYYYDVIVISSVGKKTKVVDGMVIRKGCYKPTQHNGEQTLSVVWVEENIKGEKAPEIERVPVYPDPVII